MVGGMSKNPVDSNYIHHVLRPYDYSEHPLRVWTRFERFLNKCAKYHGIELLKHSNQAYELILHAMDQFTNRRTCRDCNWKFGYDYSITARKTLDLFDECYIDYYTVQVPTAGIYDNLLIAVEYESCTFAYDVEAQMALVYDPSDDWTKRPAPIKSVPMSIGSYERQVFLWDTKGVDISEIG